MCRKSKIRCGGLTCLISFVLVLGLFAAAGGAAQLPVTSGLELRFDASAIIGLSPGDSISSWDDTSGNYRRASGGDGGATYGENQSPVGLNTVSFHGKFSEAMEFEYNPNGKDMTVIGVSRSRMQQVGWPGYHAGTVAWGETGGWGVTGPGAFNMDNVHIMLGGGPGYSRDVDYVHEKLIDYFTINRVRLNSNTHIMDVYRDGVFLGSRGDITGPIQNARPQGHIGGINFNQGFGWDGDVAEVLVYSQALTDTECQAVENYLRDKWWYFGLGGSVKAWNPDPVSSATDVPRDVTLSWAAGIYAPPVNGHKVFFSENFTDVNDGIGGIVQDANSYVPAQRLDFKKTYYWRVDEVNGPPDFTIFKGDVWSFTVEPVAYPISGTSITATASSQFNASTGPQNTINGSGLGANDLHSTLEAGVWLSSMTGPSAIGGTWIQYEFDRIYKLHQMWVWNFNQVFEPAVGFGFKDVTIEYSIDGANWTTLGTTAQFARAPGTPGYAHNTTIDLGDIAAKYVKLTANNNWGGVFNQYGLSEVRFFHIPVFAREPNPASGATDVNVDNVTLSWRAGREAAKHNVYFSTDRQAVINETIFDSPVSIPAGSSYASYDTGELELAKSYYWKVNEVNEAATPAIWQGDVWNFSTREFLVVDDFEDYNDFEPDRIFDTWIDGWADPANGSQVGYAAPPFAERTIVHGGKQSMPLSYDNSTAASYSEATANIAKKGIGQDWTKYGIKTLSLWFRGDPNNSATEKMYVKLNGSKVTYDGDAANIARAGWQQWNIELSAFGGFGVNLRNVTELIIGLERSGAAGGKGKGYFDDIRLYPQREP